MSTTEELFLRQKSRFMRYKNVDLQCTYYYYPIIYTTSQAFTHSAASRPRLQKRSRSCLCSKPPAMRPVCDIALNPSLRKINVNGYLSESVKIAKFWS